MFLFFCALNALVCEFIHGNEVFDYEDYEDDQYGWNDWPELHVFVEEEDI